jgi:hypothetical protein
MVRLAAFAGGVVLALAPWVARNTIVFGRPVLVRSSLGLRFWVGNNPMASGTWTDQEILDDPERQPRRVGALLVAGQATTFNFKARDTLPEETRAALTCTNEAERDHALLAAGLRWVGDHPDRFLALTARRALYLVAGPPPGQGDATQFLEKTLAAVVPSLGPPGGLQDETVASAWMLLRSALGATFLLSLALGLWRGTPPALLLSGLLAVWLLYYALTVVGHLGYRLSMEPFVVVGLAVGLAGTGRHRT